MSDSDSTVSNAGWDEPLGRIRWAGDRATVEFRRRYATDAADLWQAVTDPERLARWFAPVTGHTTPGGEFTLHFDDADAPQCVVLACDPPRSFRWRWDHGGSRLGGGSGRAGRRGGCDAHGAPLVAGPSERRRSRRWLARPPAGPPGTSGRPGAG